MVEDLIWDMMVTLFFTLLTTCTAFADCESGDVQLSSTSSERAGVVLVCVNGTWGKVCGGEMNTTFASVVCRQLGFSPYGNSWTNLITNPSQKTVPPFSGAFVGNRLWADSRYSYIMYQPTCIGTENNVSTCDYNTKDTVPNTCGTYSTDDTSVICLPS